MKAAVLYAPYKILIKTVERPAIKNDEVLVKVEAAGICGSDLHAFRGKHPFVKLPRILGHELSGEVAEVGKDVKEVNVGDRVVVEPVIPCGSCIACVMGRYNVCKSLKVSGAHVDGAFAEYLKAPSNRIYKIPDDLSFDDATLIEPYAVATHIVKRSGVRVGDTVAVLGAGPIGLCVLQVAKLAGAKTVVITDIVDYRLQLAKKLGADVTINSGKEDPVEIVKDATNGEGVDVAIEAVGVPSTVQQALKITRPFGQVTIAGFFEDPNVKVDVLSVIAKELHVVGSRLYWLDFKTAIDLVSKGKIDVKSIITHKFPLEEAQKAFEIFDQKIQNAVKVLLKPSLIVSKQVIDEREVILVNKRQPSRSC